MRCALAANQAKNVSGSKRRRGEHRSRRDSQPEHREQVQHRDKIPWRAREESNQLQRRAVTGRAQSFA
jgi:hypothetical protein